MHFAATVAGGIQSTQTQKILKNIQGQFLPRTVVLVRDPETNADKLDQIAAIVKAHEPIEGKVTVYLCEDFVCKRPITEIRCVPEGNEGTAIEDQGGGLGIGRVFCLHDF